MVLSTQALQRPVRVNVLLPRGYGDTTRRYPSYYLFHGTSGGADDWLEMGGAERWAIETIALAREAGFLPIVLTSLTAIGGLLPIAVQGSGMYAPLAWVIIGGLVHLAEDDVALHHARDVRAVRDPRQASDGARRVAGHLVARRGSLQRLAALWRNRRDGIRRLRHEHAGHHHQQDRPGAEIAVLAPARDEDDDLPETLQEFDAYWRRASA